jgi:hypothetical protein
MSEKRRYVGATRLTGARCEVTYSGGLNAFEDRLADAHQRAQFSPTTTSS